MEIAARRLALTEIIIMGASCGPFFLGGSGCGSMRGAVWLEKEGRDMGVFGLIHL